MNFPIKEATLYTHLLKQACILAPPLFIEEVARSAGGVRYNVTTLFQKTPSRLRRTPSINRGRA